MRTLHYIKTLLLLCALMLTMSAWCISPELTIPRIGDKLHILKLTNSPQWIDTTSLSPDFSKCVFKRAEKMTIYAPSERDTVSTFVVATFMENIQVIQRGDTLFQRKRIVPGRTRTYDSMPLYGMPVVPASKDTVKTHGKTNQIGKFVTFGVWNTSKIKGLTAITIESDTLRNVECVQTDIEETLIYSSNDTTLFKGTVKKWYAPGYRYPILSYEAGTLFSVEGDTLDAVCNWNATRPSEQRENIKEDPVNELIRDRYENMKFESQYSPGDNSDQPSANGNNGYVYYDKNRQSVIINPTFAMDDDGERAYILCDISGIVYDGGMLSAEGVMVSTETYPPGTYLVHISTSNEPIVYKFKVAP